MNPQRDTRTIKQTAEIPAKPEQVYKAYTDPEQHTAFTGEKATGEAKVGNTVSAFDGYITAKYVELVPGKRIVQEWRTNANPARGASGWPANYPPSILEITLEPKGEGTKLTMVHREVPAEHADQYADGWKKKYWKPLEEHFTKKK